MKIIDLLNKIANDEEVPYRIKYNGRIYEYAEEIKWYLRDDMKCELSNSKKCLNDEVEIIEETIEDRYREMEKVKNYKPNPSYLSPKEEKKIPEKLGLTYLKDDDRNKIIDKINEVIDYLDYLKSKGDE